MLPSALTLCRRTTKFHVVCERGMYLAVSHARLPSEESGVPGLPKFGILLHHLTQKDQIRHGNIIIWGGAFLGCQQRHCICTNASRDLSEIAELLVPLSVLMSSVLQLNTETFSKTFMLSTKLSLSPCTGIRQTCTKLSTVSCSLPITSLPPMTPDGYLLYSTTSINLSNITELC